ncbi:MAG: hydroxyacid dehydrogenase [Candidatus Micrarchaeota archaeon]
MKILITDNMEREVVEKIKNLGEVVYLPQNLDVALADAEILIVRSQTKVTRELLSKAKKLKLVARGGVGLDNVDQKACEERGIKVLNTPGASTDSVAELAVTLVSVLLRKIVQAHNQMKNKIWDRKKLVGKEMKGKTLGIIGFGRIGSAVGERANMLGMKVLACNATPVSSDFAKEVDLDTLLRESDVVTLHVWLNEETRKMINEEKLALMKNGAYLINTARGEVIDEDALYDALKSGKLGGAALDVLSKEPYDGKLLELDNVIFTSHIGANTTDAQNRIGEELVARLKEFCASDA